MTVAAAVDLINGTSTPDLTCQCGKKFSTTELSLDCMPKSQGGKTTMGQHCLLLHECNVKKGSHAKQAILIVKPWRRDQHPWLKRYS